MRDFTLESYQLLLKSFQNNGYEFHDLASFIGNLSQKSIFLRHDIDRYTDRIEKFAKLERSLGIRSTFYFRMPHKPVHYKTIEKVVNEHHDIGYHYNDLAQHKGNIQEAIKSFSNNLSALRATHEVKSICMHGNALSSINNLELLKNVDCRKFGLTGDPYLMIDHQKVLYITDTGRCWNCNKYNKWDRVQSGFTYYPLSASSIVSDLEEGRLPGQLHLCIHPQHYYDNIMKWTLYYLIQFVKNPIKAQFIKADHS